ncbi:unannotated protein [freshwater metagenome]|uniref:Unannotated protein n=1 Tax=freshwater metagenome TaxID=449393 RepID=A0A6J7EYB3_9ZZZZ
MRFAPAATAVSDVGNPETAAVGAVQAVTMAPTSSRPLFATLPVSESVGLALSTTARLSCLALSAGLIEAQSAMAPETWGVAIDVPLSEA